VLSGSRDYLPLLKVTALLLVLGVFACATVIGRAIMSASRPGDAGYVRIVAIVVGGLWSIAFMSWLRNARS
jgi:hypothetical protein